MNDAGISLVWCAVQVTLIGTITGTAYVLARRIRPGAGLPVLLSGLATVLLLTALAFSPWPRWSLPSRPESADVESSNRIAPSAEAGTTASEAEQEIPGDAHPEGTVGSASDVSFGRILLEELSRAAAAQRSSAWSWPAVVTAVFLGAGGLALTWFAVGAAAVRGYRRRSRAVREPALLEQVDRLRADLGCAKRVGLRETDELVTAATIGWRCPIVLLPSGWREWTVKQRSAVLAHELAHIRSGDYLAVTLGHVGLLLHFYHPLVHWLLSRLRLEQELAADAAAASVSGGQRAYLKTIAELALRQPHRPMAWPARSFLPTRTTFLRRISMLRDSKSTVEKLSPTARLVPIATILVFGVLIAGLRGPVGDRPVLAGQSGEAAPTASESPGEPSDDVVFDPTYVHKDAWGLIAIRPSAVFGRPEFKELGKILGETPGPVRELGMALEELEQVTFVICEPREAVLGKRPGPDENVTIIVRAGRAHTFDKIAQHLPGETTIREHKGRTYHISTRGVRMGYCRPDDRTLVIGSEDTLKRAIDSRDEGLPSFIDPDIWREFRGDDLILAARSADLVGMVKMADGPEIAAILSPISPLWESTSSIVLGARLNDRLQVHGVAVSDERSQTKQVKQTLDALSVLTLNATNEARARFRGVPSDQAKLLSFSLDTCAELLDNFDVKRDGAAVRLATSADLGSVSLGPLAQAVQAARLAARRAQSTNNLKQIALAMHNFHDTHKRFPAAAGRTSKSQQENKSNPPHSWRVAILPFLGQAPLYDQYRFDLPWDSPENLKILGQMPTVYRSLQTPAGTTEASYFALTGPVTVFSGEKGTPIREIRDGCSNTLLVVEAKRSIPWTKPEDIPYDATKPLPNLGGHFEGGFHASLCDGSVRFYADSIDENTLRAMISMSGGERFTFPR